MKFKLGYYYLKGDEKSFWEECERLFGEPKKKSPLEESLNNTSASDDSIKSSFSEDLEL